MVDLARPGNALFGIRHQLFPVSKPARNAANREQDGEHLRPEAHGLVDDSGVEVDVRVEPPLDEVVVLERDPFQLHREVDLGVPAGDLKDLFGNLAHDAGAWVVVPVDTMSEPHQPPLAGLHLAHEVGDVLDRSDRIQHRQDRLIGAAVQRAVERRGRRGNAHVRVGVRAADLPHR